MAETPIVSPTLQNDFRTTFPSQVSSGRDLHVSDVIVPIVDFSSTATGSTLSELLNNAVDFATTDTGLINNSSATVVNTPGFYKITGACLTEAYTANATTHFTIDDGSTTKVVYTVGINNNGNDNRTNYSNFEFVSYLTAGMTLTLVASFYGWARAHSRQVADVSGVATVPLNYTS